MPCWQLAPLIFEKYLSEEEFFMRDSSMAKIMNFIGNQPNKIEIQKQLYKEALAILEKINTYQMNYMTIM